MSHKDQVIKHNNSYVLPRSGTMKTDVVAFLSDELFISSEDEMWNPMTAYAGQTFELTGVAPTSKATDFVIEIEGF